MLMCSMSKKTFVHGIRVHDIQIESVGTSYSANTAMHYYCLNFKCCIKSVWVWFLSELAFHVYFKSVSFKYLPLILHGFYCKLTFIHVKYPWNFSSPTFQAPSLIEIKAGTILFINQTPQRRRKHQTVELKIGYRETLLRSFFGNSDLSWSKLNYT